MFKNFKFFSLGLPNIFSKDKISGLDKETSSTESTVQPYADQPYLPKIGNTHRVAGLHYRKENVLKLAKINPSYTLSENQIIKKGLQNTKIHKYLFPDGPIVLEQEPTNPHDPNAIKVVVAGQHIGYIKAGSCAHVNKLINENRIEKILCRISGGPFKAVYLIDNEDPRKKPKYELDEGSTDLRAEIRIVEFK